jgi:hypothetical protein
MLVRWTVRSQPLSDFLAQFLTDTLTELSLPIKIE